jgi:hypothetical protein
MARELGEDGNCALILKELVKNREKNKRGLRMNTSCGEQFTNHGTIGRV